MSDQPLVSVIIPTYNRSHLIGETLDSVLAQTYQNWECIVVDDGSNDETIELMQFYCGRDTRILFYKREIMPKGASHCRNIGLEKAKGKFCIFLDSDDLLLDFCLETRVKSIQLYHNRDFWVFPMLTENSHKKLTKCKIPEKSDYLEDFLSSKFHWGIMCTFWEINFLRSINGFNILYPRLNDPEIHIRAFLRSKLNYVVFTNNEPDSIYRLYAVKKEKTAIALIYYKSLILFIPDITNELIRFNKTNKIHFLKEFLKDYTKIYFQYNSRPNNLQLFRVFYKNKILSYNEFLNLKLFYYVFLILNKLSKQNRKLMKIVFEKQTA